MILLAWVLTKPLREKNCKIYIEYSSKNVKISFPILGNTNLNNVGKYPSNIIHSFTTRLNTWQLINKNKISLNHRVANVRLNLKSLDTKFSLEALPF